MSSYVITGGKPLFGSVRVGGAKNASYKLMIAALLADTPSRILNFSKISDVALVGSLINSLGAKAQPVGERAYMIDPSGLHNPTISPEHGEASRASTMFIPSLLAKLGKAVVPFPGGDKIGKRSLDWHFDGLRAMGAQITTENGVIEASCPDGLQGTTYRFLKNSHTGTETLIMAAVKARGTTILENAAEETEVDDLIEYLNLMGARIEKIAPRTLKIEGVDKLQGTIFKIMPDQNQVVSFACAALATKGDVIVENARTEDLESFLAKLDAIGAGYEVSHYGIRFYFKGEMRATNVTTEAHPGFKTDWQPLWVTLMTQVHGVSVLHETIYNSRFGYVSALQKMGATIELFNPEVTNPEELYNFSLKDISSDDKHAARITGPTQLHGGEFTVKDLRHGATLMIAGMTADGQTILHDPEKHIDRGYERLDQQLISMGATIERIEN